MVLLWKDIWRWMAHTVLPHCPVPFHPGSQWHPSLPSLALDPEQLNLSQPLCQVLSPLPADPVLSHSTLNPCHPCQSLSWNAILLSMLSSNNFGQHHQALTVHNTHANLPPSNSLGAPSEPLKRADKVGCYNCSLFGLQPPHCSLVLPLCPTSKVGGSNLGGPHPVPLQRAAPSTAALTKTQRVIPWCRE